MTLDTPTKVRSLPPCGGGSGESAAVVRTQFDFNPSRSEWRRPRLKAGRLHLAAIVLTHFACMSLIVWLSL
ncbi:hypothetical protein CO683_08880 [Bradyrhizobium ottawaense]|uniref:Uncharacterized protein n=1 Tax=Bradyrhizobium ottawaense TaxID=931866 RepID=A0A2U8PB47_9BRAD|nr:hypothetical protein CIT37_22285 [Bradyrhizobium ottawaense]PDT69867.1 hypothetical protein CO683_08880 [Bradyrhizobium ottawaense]